MKLITSKEIHSLYKKVGLDPNVSFFVNRNINMGTLKNKLSGIETLSKSTKVLKTQIDSNIATPKE